MKKYVAMIIMISAMTYITVLAGGDGQHRHGTETAGTKTEQTKCPVLPFNEIDKDVYTVYKGKKVYFCCEHCKKEFLRNPEEYTDNLPRFIGGTSSGKEESSSAGDHEEHDHTNGSKVASILHDFIIPLGITTYVMLLLTMLVGIFQKKNPRALLKWHKGLAYATVFIATCHALTVILIEYIL